MSFRRRQQARSAASNARRHVISVVDEPASPVEAALREAVVQLADAVDLLADECEELEKK